MANYIHTLQNDRAALTETVAEIGTELDDLIAYLQSPKFACGDDLDGYVSTSDVLARLAHARSLALPDMY